VQSQWISGGRDDRYETDAMMADSVSESLSGEEWAEAISWRMVSRPSGAEVIWRMTTTREDLMRTKLTG